MLIADQNAVITGCNRGIGQAILKVFARNGANIWACARRPSDEFGALVEDLRHETGVRIDPVYFDLAEGAEVKAAAQRIAGDRRPIHILVNNAGAIATAPFIMTAETALREMFEVNFLAQTVLTQQVARIMVRQRRGRIVNIASSAALDGNEGRTAYAAAKAALVAATKVAARELGPANVCVNAIAPGLTETEMMTRSTAPDAIDATLKRTALRRAGQPEEIAAAALFLASPLSSYVTGQVLRVDGGM